MWSRLASRRSTPSSANTAPIGGAAIPADLVDPRVMEQIGHLELLSRTVVDGLLAGKHRSTTRGGCCEFSQHRPYSAGDEIRHIDWQVYGRNDRHYIRQFEEETNLHALLAVDTSGSMGFRHAGVSKLDYACRAAACLARLLLRQRDAVGATLLNESRPVYLQPRQHAAHLQAVLTALHSAVPAAGSDLGALIRSCVPRLKRRGLFLLFSDCFCDLEELGTALRLVRSRGHDVIVFQVLAPEELQFDFRHWSGFQSLEVAGQRIRLDPAAIRDAYLARLRQFLTDLDSLVTGLGGDCVRMTTTHDLGDVLKWFLRSRQCRS